MAQQRATVLEIDEGVVILVDHDRPWHRARNTATTVVERDAPRAMVDVVAGIAAVVMPLAGEFLQRESLVRRLAASASKGARFKDRDRVGDSYTPRRSWCSALAPSRSPSRPGTGMRAASAASANQPYFLLTRT